MPPVKRKGFFNQTPPRPEDELARQQDVEALIVPRRTVVQELPVERVRPNPFQARKQFENLQELANAIKAQGFTSRLRVRPDPYEEGYFQLVYGERRLRAAILAGRTEVPCEIADHSDAEMIEVGLAENIQRSDLTPLEEAQAFQAFTKERGYTIRSLAEKIGKDKSYVDDRLSLLRIPQDVQDMVAQRSDTLRAAREIAKLATPDQRKPLIEGVLEGTLNVQDVRAIIAQASEDKAKIEIETEQTFSTSQQASLPEATINSSSFSSNESESPSTNSGGKEKNSNKKRETNLDHIIERDGRLLLSTLARWRDLLPALTEKQRTLLLFYTEQASTELDNIKQNTE